MQLRPALGCTLAVLAAAVAAVAAPGEARAQADITLLSSDPVDCGDVTVGTDSEPVSIEIRNDGDEDLVDIVGYVAAGDFYVESDAAGTLAPGETGTWTVICQPTSTGTVNGTFVILSSDGDTPEIDLGLACNGLPPPLEFSPGPLDFGEVRVGDPAPLIIVTLTAAETLEITDISFDSGELALTKTPTYPVPMNPGDTFLIQVAWTPTGDEDLYDTLYVETEPQGTLWTDVYGVAVTAAAELSSASLDLGSLCAGATTTVGTTLMSAGTGWFNLTGGTAVSAPFAILDPVVPDEYIDSESSRDFMFSFSPTADGTYDDSYAISTDIPGASDFVVALHGVAIDSGVGVSPADIDFGDVDVDDTSGGSDVTVSNCGGAAVTVSSVQIIGDDAGEFQLSGPTAPVSIGGDDSEDWTVVFVPSGAGVRVASVEIVHDLGTATIPLTGNGVAPDPDMDAGPSNDGGGDDDDDDDNGADDESSYYACDAGGAAGGVALAVALVCVLLAARRRRTR